MENPQYRALLRADAGPTALPPPYKPTFPSLQQPYADYHLKGEKSEVRSSLRAGQCLSQDGLPPWPRSLPDLERGHLTPPEPPEARCSCHLAFCPVDPDTSCLALICPLNGELGAWGEAPAVPQSHPVPRDRKAAAMITGFLWWETGVRGLDDWKYWEEQEG